VTLLAEALIALRDPEFIALQRRNPRYARALRFFAEQNPMLAASAAFAFRRHGEELARVAEDVLGFLDAHAPNEYLALYERRVLGLMRMQRAFLAAPSAEGLRGRGLPVDRQSYDVALLASIVFTSHRFQIMQQLAKFLRPFAGRSARVACIGAGTGYELLMARRTLVDARIDGYDTDPRAQDIALQLLSFFDATRDVTLAGEFPPMRSADDGAVAYDAIVCCELLEHLPDPRDLLEASKRTLRQGGKAFVTMAVNLAQEDHVYWYADIESCRVQLADAGFRVENETFVSARAQERSREQGLDVGNYVAEVSPC
jgi:SAM-dependent methyltransferase